MRLTFLLKPRWSVKHLSWIRLWQKYVTTNLNAVCFQIAGKFASLPPCLSANVRLSILDLRDNVRLSCSDVSSNSNRFFFSAFEAKPHNQ